jgi:hypothetical protein
MGRREVPVKWKKLKTLVWALAEGRRLPENCTESGA